MRATTKEKFSARDFFATPVRRPLSPTFCQGAEQALGPAKADLSNMRSMLFQRWIHECVLLLYNNRHLFNSYRQLSTCIFMFIYLQLSNIHVCIYVHLFTTFYDYTVHMIHVFMYVHLFTVSSTIWWTTVASCMIGNSRWTNQCHQVFQCLHLWPKQ